MKEKQFEELINDICDICRLRTKCSAETKCTMVRAEAEALIKAGYRKQGEWISVDERLPTEQKDFLVYYGFDRGDGDLGMMFTGVLTYFAYDKKPHFQHEKSGAGLRVTHWMPLPQAPNGE